MFKPNRFLCLLTAAAVVLTLTGVPGIAVAGGRPWHSQADELPGMSGGTVLLYALGAAAVVTVVILIARHSDADKDKKAEEGKTEEKKSEDAGDAGSLRSTAADRIPLACSLENDDHLSPSNAEGHPVNLILGIAPDHDGAAETAVAIGVQVAF